MPDHKEIPDSVLPMGALPPTSEESVASFNALRREMGFRDKPEDAARALFAEIGEVTRGLAKDIDSIINSFIGKDKDQLNPEEIRLLLSQVKVLKADARRLELERMLLKSRLTEVLKDYDRTFQASIPG